MVVLVLLSNHEYINNIYFLQIARLLGVLYMSQKMFCLIPRICCSDHVVQQLIQISEWGMHFSAKYN